MADVSKRLGVSTHSLYAWMKRFSKPPVVAEEAAEVKAATLLVARGSCYVKAKKQTFDSIAALDKLDSDLTFTAGATCFSFYVR